jgi:hypothetical protein
MPTSRNSFEMYFFMFLAPVQEKKEVRPYFPYMLLTVETQSSTTLGNEMLKSDPSPKAIWGSIPETVARQLARAGIIPEEVTVGSEFLFRLLEPLAWSLCFELKQPRILPNLHPLEGLLIQTI